MTTAQQLEMFTAASPSIRYREAVLAGHSLRCDLRWAGEQTGCTCPGRRALLGDARARVLDAHEAKCRAEWLAHKARKDK